MAKLSVFQEKEIYFGIFDEDCTAHYPMNHFIIKCHNPLDYIWNFDFPLQNMRGSICNIGTMLDDTQNHFDLSDEVFFTKINGIDFGVKLANPQSTREISRDSETIKANDGKSDIENFSLNMLIKECLVENDKKIYIIKPDIVANAFRMIL